MNAGPQVRLLPDGQRLHLHHGPIDLILGAEGPGRDAAFDAAAARFGTVLPGLVSELDGLLSQYNGRSFADPVARRMADAVAPLAVDGFVTPMAAVAGAVADEIIEVLVAGQELTKAYVNNGGDIAFFLTDGQELQAGGPAGPIRVTAGDAARGLATSGWRGRSQSLGIADAVTVLARCAARADAAATLIANRVDLPGHPAIRRVPAHEVETHPQLGDRLVTVGVGPLSTAEVDAALAPGAAYAQALLDRGLIEGAALRLGAETRLVGAAAPLSLDPGCARVHLAAP